MNSILLSCSLAVSKQNRGQFFQLGVGAHIKTPRQGRDLQSRLLNEYNNSVPETIVKITKMAQLAKMSNTVLLENSFVLVTDQATFNYQNFND